MSSFFSDLFNPGQGYQEAANAQIQGLNQAYGQASGLYGQGRDALNSNYGNASNLYGGLLQSANAGASAYGDATGANGSAGLARATANFQAAPSYSFDFTQGLQGIDRGAAAKGMVTSGNTLTAEQNFGTGLANQTYQQYVQNLSPYLGQQSGAVSGAAGVATGLGNALNTSYGNQGNLAYNTQTGIGNANAASDLATQNAANSFLNGAVNLGGKLLGFM